MLVIFILAYFVILGLYPTVNATYGTQYIPNSPTREPIVMNTGNETFAVRLLNRSKLFDKQKSELHVVFYFEEGIGSLNRTVVPTVLCEDFYSEQISAGEEFYV